jgi:glycosyltransferase involved in cell wall biosynthesis
MDPSPRLLYLMNEALFFTTHRMPVARAARDAGFEVHVAAPYMAGAVETIRANGFRYHDVPLDRGSLRPLAELELLRAFHALIRELRPDLLHAVAMKPVLYGGLLARLARVPAVVHAITGLGYLFLRQSLGAKITRGLVTRLYRYALGHPNVRAIFQNPDDLGLFLEGRLVDPARAVTIKGCGVDLAEFRPGPEREGPVTVMFPARLIGDKGVREFVEAAEIIGREGAPARFVLVGRNDPQNPTNVPEAEIRDWERRGIVEWWGFRDDMAATLGQAHVVAMPSYREGLPRVLIEAAACGRPIVSADVPGCREIVREGENGLLVPARDGRALAAAIRRLIDDGGLRRRLGERGRAIAEAEFSVEHLVAAHMALYRALLPDAALTAGGA